MKGMQLNAKNLLLSIAKIGKAIGVAMVAGELCEPDTDVAQIHTVDQDGGAMLADGGTFRLGYKGEWTTDIAWNASAATTKTAFELLTTVTDTITFSAAYPITGTTATWTTAGPKAEIEWDPALLLDSAVVMTTRSPVSTIGSLVASMVLVATGASVTGILLKAVSEDDIQNNNNIERAFLVRGAAICDSDQIYCIAAQKAAGLAAMVALGVQMRQEPDIYTAGLD